MSAIEVKVPDIGDFKDVPVIEIPVKPGDVVKADDPLIVLESDKASMEVPSPAAGKVLEILVKLGDKVGEGSLILTLEAEGAAACAAACRQRPRRQSRAGSHRRDRSRRRQTDQPGPDHRLDQLSAQHRGRFFQRPRLAVGAASRPRTRTRPDQSHGHRRQGPRHQGGRQGFPRRRQGCGPGRCFRRLRHSRNPDHRLFQIRSDRGKAAVADQEIVGPFPAPLLAQRARRHAA